MLSLRGANLDCITRLVSQAAITSPSTPLKMWVYSSSRKPRLSRKWRHNGCGSQRGAQLPQQCFLALWQKTLTSHFGSQSATLPSTGLVDRVSQINCRTCWLFNIEQLFNTAVTTSVSQGLYPFSSKEEVRTKLVNLCKVFSLYSAHT